MSTLSIRIDKIRQKEAAGELPAGRADAYLAHAIEHDDKYARLHRPVWQAIREGREVPAVTALEQQHRQLSTGAAHTQVHRHKAGDDLETGTGPGSQLMRMLKAIGITSEPGCACRARARRMNEWGPSVCREQIGTTVGWLQEEAQKRELPFSGLAARVLVTRAIRRAEREEGKGGG